MTTAGRGAVAEAAVGIDLGGTAVKAGAIAADGRILARRSIPTELERGAADLFDRIAALARAFGAEGALGIGTPGLLDRERGVVRRSPNLRAIEGFGLRAEIARRLALPESAISIENDANTAALAEHWLGIGREQRDFLLVTLGTGIGGALVLGGELYTGSGGMAGEIGHTVIEPQGEICECGARGCLETLASATAASRRARALALPASAPGDLIALTAAARAQPGPERDLCLAIGRDLGHGLGTAVALLDLRCFVVGGGFGSALDVLEPGIRVGIGQSASYGARDQAIVIRRASLGSDAGWIGAARLALGARARSA